MIEDIEKLSYDDQQCESRVKFDSKGKLNDVLVFYNFKGQENDSII